MNIINSRFKNNRKARGDIPVYQKPEDKKPKGMTVDQAAAKWPAVLARLCAEPPKDK
jgi:hypothetical protein